MKFAIGDLEYFNSLGFNTEHWRKSVDGTKAMAHSEFVLTLADKNQLEIYDIQGESFKTLLASPEWTKEEYVEDVYSDEGLIIHNGKEEAQ